MWQPQDRTLHLELTSYEEGVTNPTHWIYRIDRPGSSGAPSTASVTVAAQPRFGRRDRLAVKAGLICCAITVGGHCAG